MARAKNPQGSHRLSFSFRFHVRKEKKAHDFIQGLPNGKRTAYVVDAVIEKMARDSQQEQMSTMNIPDMIEAAVKNSFQKYAIVASPETGNAKHSSIGEEQEIEKGAIEEMNIRDDIMIDDSVANLF